MVPDCACTVVKSEKYGRAYVVDTWAHKRVEMVRLSFSWVLPPRNGVSTLQIHELARGTVIQRHRQQFLRVHRSLTAVTAYQTRLKRTVNTRYDFNIFSAFL